MSDSSQRAGSDSLDTASIRAERDRYREALEMIAALLPEDARAIAKEALWPSSTKARPVCACGRSDEGTVICWICGGTVE